MVFFLFGCISFFLLVGYWKKHKVVSIPAFTVAKVTGKEDGTKGTKYILYDYWVNSKKYSSRQSLTSILSRKRKLNPIKDSKYLVIYNKEHPNRSHLINIRPDAEFGTDLSHKYSLDSIEKVGLISFVNF